MFEKLKDYLDKTNPIPIYLSNGNKISTISVEEEIGNFIKVTGYAFDESGKKTELNKFLININQISYIHLDPREEF